METSRMMVDLLSEKGCHLLTEKGSAQALHTLSTPSCALSPDKMAVYTKQEKDKRKKTVLAVRSLYQFRRRGRTACMLYGLLHIAPCVNGRLSLCPSPFRQMRASHGSWCSPLWTELLCQCGSVCRARGLPQQLLPALHPTDSTVQMQRCRGWGCASGLPQGHLDSGADGAVNGLWPQTKEPGPWLPPTIPEVDESTL